MSSSHTSLERKGAVLLLSGFVLALLMVLASAAPDDSLNAFQGGVGARAANPNPPARTVKLIFIHHSTGENWLADGDGGLGIALREDNYFVSDTNYGWGPDGIGDTTNIGH